MSVVKVFSVEGAKLPAVKAILDAPETNPEMQKLLAERDKAEENVAKMKKRKDHAEMGPLQAAEDALKAIDQKIEELKKAGGLKINEFARNGYTLRAAAGIGLPGEMNYLYIKAPDEAFFKRNQPSIEKAGAKELRGAEAEKVKKAFESSEESSASGMGLIFGGG